MRKVWGTGAQAWEPRGCNHACGKVRSEEHTSELQSQFHLVCRLLLERYGDHRDLHSFPTRRSSDLQRGAWPEHFLKSSAPRSIMTSKDIDSSDRISSLGETGHAKGLGHRSAGLGAPWLQPRLRQSKIGRAHV